MLLGRKLAKYRQQAGFTQREAAERLGISRETLINYERGHTELRLSIFLKMAELYKFDIIEATSDVHDSEGLLYDVPIYYMIKAHSRFVVYSEIQSQSVLFEPLPDSSYNARFARQLKHDIERFKSMYAGLLEEFEKDEDTAYHSL